MRTIRVLVTAATLLVPVAAVVAPVAMPAGAQGVATLTVTPGTIPATGASVTLSGANFLEPPNASFGGVYVFFGWVKPGTTWGPSNRGDGETGQFGYTYMYPGQAGDGDTRDHSDGSSQFVAFSASTPGSPDFGVTPYEITNGSFSLPLRIPGPVWSWVLPGVPGLRDERSGTIDCRQVQCGVFTIGAHGVRSRTNETFAPITYAAPGAPPSNAPSSGSTGQAVTPAPGLSAAPPVVAVKPATATRPATKTPAKAAATTAPPATATPAPAPAPTDTTALAPVDTTTTVPAETTTTTTTDKADHTSSSATELASARRRDDAGSSGATWLWISIGLVLLVAFGGTVLVRRKGRAAPAMTEPETTTEETP